MKTEYMEKIEQLYIELYEMMIQYAGASLKNDSMAEEAVRDSFRIACMKPKEVCNSPNPRGWMLLTLKYVIKNMVRNQASANRLAMRVIAEITCDDDILEEEPNLALLYGNLAQTEEFKLICGIAEGKSILELADERGISVEACKKRVQRARQFLKKKISE